MEATCVETPATELEAMPLELAGGGAALELAGGGTTLELTRGGFELAGGFALELAGGITDELAGGGCGELIGELETPGWLLLTTGGTDEGVTAMVD